MPEYKVCSRTCALSATRLANNMRLPLSELALFTLFITTSGIASADDATEWLERMSESTHKLNYVGNFVYMQEGRLESMRLVHAVTEQGVSERLVSLSGANREVIREHGQVTCYLPEKEALVADHPDVPPGFPLNLPTQWEQLRNVYEFKVMGQTRVAGQPAQHIAIVPRDSMRYGQNYWIAKDSGLLLRTDIVDEQGTVMEQLEFTSLQVVQEISPDMLKPDSGSKALTLPEATQQTAKINQPLHWVVNKLPAGFELELQRQHAIASNGVEVEHLIYSDGLTSVSVFIEPRHDDEDEEEGSTQRGSVHAYTRLLPEQRITVLGEVPLATVTQIAESIAPLVP